MSGELNSTFLEQGTNNEKKARVNSSGELLIDKTGLATSDKQDALLTELQNKADVTETQPVSAVSLPLPDNAATESTLSTISSDISNGLNWGWRVMDSGGTNINPATSEGLSDGSQKTQVVDSNNKTIVPTTPTDIQLSELIPVLRSLITAIANPSYVDKSANQMRSQVTGTLTTVTTVTTVTNLTNLGTFPADHLQIMANMTAWATNIRSLIT